MANIIDVQIKSEYITLSQFLKITDLIDSGGQARLFLNDNMVIINGEEDRRRGRKLYPGYLINIKGKSYRIC